MGSLSYLPGRSTLLLLFKAARGRLTATSEYMGSLSDARITSATEEMNQISDDIREAIIGFSVHDDAARRASKLAPREAPLRGLGSPATTLRPLPNEVPQLSGAQIIASPPIEKPEPDVWSSP
jgi:hypothetical protein